MNEKRGFDPRFMEELKQKNNIVEVIASYVSLDKKGNTHWACCPFHHEKTPSFAVNEIEQFYHCFGCGVSGDVVKFVQEIESTDFMGAVRILAARAKMTVPESNFDNERAIALKKKRDTLAQIMKDSAKFYLSNLYTSGAEAHLSYISRRGLSPTTVKKFGLGASLDFNTLPEYLAGKGYSREDLIDSGAVAEGKNGKLFDVQAGRLIFPIINHFNEVVAFGGRLLEKADFAKYKNTKETLLFNKSKTLYNVNLLKKMKREEAIQEVIIVEGYMDTISLYQAGFHNVVASMGTSLTKDQARLVKRYSDNILISYDGDFAGQKADLRGLEILKDENLRVKVVPMPEGLDPDDVARQGKEAYQACLDKAMPLIDYKIHALERKYNLQKTEEKREYVGEALKIIRTAENESEREDLLKKLHRKVGITYQSLERDLQNLPKEERETVPVEMGMFSPSNKYKKASRFILAAKLFSQKYTDGFSIEEIEFDDNTHKIIAEYIARCEKAGERKRPSDLFEMLDENDGEFSEILALNYEDNLTGDVAKKFFLDSFITLKQAQYGEKIKFYTQKAEAEEDREKQKEYTKKILEYTVKMKQAVKKYK